MAKITLAEIEEISTELKWVTMLGVSVEEIGEGSARLRLPASDSVLRPGGTVSGPAMMTLADFAMYVAVWGDRPGRDGADNNLSINFLHAAAGRSRRGMPATQAGQAAGLWRSPHHQRCHRER